MSSGFSVLLAKWFCLWFIFDYFAARIQNIISHRNAHADKGTKSFLISSILEMLRTETIGARIYIVFIQSRPFYMSIVQSFFDKCVLWVMNQGLVVFLGKLEFF